MRPGRWDCASCSYPWAAVVGGMQPAAGGVSPEIALPPVRWVGHQPTTPAPPGLGPSVLQGGGRSEERHGVLKLTPALLAGLLVAHH